MDKARFVRSVGGAAGVATHGRMTFGNYTCGRFKTEHDANASVTAAVLLLALAFVSAVSIYCFMRGWIPAPSVFSVPRPVEFNLLDDDEDDENSGYPDDYVDKPAPDVPNGLLTAETSTNA